MASLVLAANQCNPVCGPLSCVQRPALICLASRSTLHVIILLANSRRVPAINAEEEIGERGEREDGEVEYERSITKTNTATAAGRVTSVIRMRPAALGDEMRMAEGWGGGRKRWRGGQVAGTTPRRGHGSAGDRARGTSCRRRRWRRCLLRPSFPAYAPRSPSTDALSSRVLVPRATHTHAITTVCLSSDNQWFRSFIVTYCGFISATSLLCALPTKWVLQSRRISYATNSLCFQYRW